MKFDMRFRPGDDVRTVWLLAICVLVAGSFYIQKCYQAAIAASYGETERLYEQTVANARIVNESVKLREIEAQARVDLAHISHNASLSASTANLLATLQRSANRFDTMVIEVAPGKDGPATKNPLQATSIVIRVRGKFRGILRFVEDLSHHSTLISVSDTEMAIAHDGGTDETEPRLDATVHATLYRLRLPEDKELRVASAP